MHDDMIQTMLADMRSLVAQDVPKSEVADRLSAKLEVWRANGRFDDADFAAACKRLALLLKAEMDTLTRAAAASLAGSEIIVSHVAALEAALDVAWAMANTPISSID